MGPSVHNLSSKGKVVEQVGQGHAIYTGHGLWTKMDFGTQGAFLDLKTNPTHGSLPGSLPEWACQTTSKAAGRVGRQQF